MISVMNFFGDDDVNGPDGVFGAASKLRKWLYLTSGLAIMVSLRHVQPGQIENFLKVVSADYRGVAWTVLASLTYVIVHYSLLLWQVGLTYPIILTQRLAFRNQDRVEEARDRLTQTIEQLENVRKIISDFRQNPRIAEVEREIEAERVRIEAGIKRLEEINPPTDSLDSEVRNLRWEQDALPQSIGRKQMEIVMMNAAKNQVPADANLKSLEDAVQQRRGDLVKIAMTDPAATPGYELIERLRDTLRLAPPLLFGLGALTNLLLAIHHGTVEGPYGY